MSHANDHIQSRVEFPLCRNFYVRTQIKLGANHLTLRRGVGLEKKNFLALNCDRLLFLIILIYVGDRRWASINKRIEPLHMTSRPTCWSGFVQVMKNGKSWNLSISFSRPGKSWNWIVGSGKSWKLKLCLIDPLLKMTRQGQCKINGSNWTGQTARILVDTRVCVCWLFKIQKYPKTREVFKIFESDS